MKLIVCLVAAVQDEVLARGIVELLGRAGAVQARYTQDAPSVPRELDGSNEHVVFLVSDAFLDERELRQVLRDFYTRRTRCVVVLQSSVHAQDFRDPPE